MTTTRATISKGYRIRLLLIALGLLFWTGLCIKDGFFTYPEQSRIYAELQQFKEDNPDWQQEWKAYAQERGYPTNVNKVKERYEKDVLTQHLMTAGCLPIGLWFLWGWHRAGGRWVEADDQGIRNNKGQNAAWDAVTGVADERWKSKGIANVLFKDDQGQEQRLLLDDWKFGRDETQAIYKQVMAHLHPEQAEGDDQGSPEDAETGEPVNA